MVVQGCRLVPKGRVNVIMWVCELFKIDKNILKPACMENLDLGVREHSPSAATTSHNASVQEVCDPFQAATGSPYSVLFFLMSGWLKDSVLFGARILLRPARNSMRGWVQECIFPVLLRLHANFGLRC